MLEAKNYINGEWCDAVSGKTQERTNPANKNEVIGRFPASDGVDARKAIDAAQAAFSAWRQVPAPKRALVLQKAIEIIRANVDAIARDLSLEQGKPLREATGEVNRGLEEMEFFVGEGCRVEGRHIPSAREGAVCYTTRAPMGVISGITPWNYPFVPAIRKIAPAVVFGDTMVLKPASLTPFTSAHIVRSFAEAGLPAGVLNMVIGSGSSVGRELVENPLVRGISLTGSVEVGRKIAQGAALHNAKLQLEMGGKNPAVVFPSADLPRAAAEIAARSMTCAGQICVSISRAIVHKSIEKELCDMIEARLRQVVVGPGLDPETTMGPLVSEEQLESVLGYVKKGVDEGANLVVGGERLTGPKYDNGNFMSPTMFTNVDPNSTIGQEEIFGPVLSVTTFSDFDEAMEIANSVRYGLAACAYTSQIDEALAFLDQAQAGMVQVNLPTYVDAFAPFGGVKDSGYGPFSVSYSCVEFFTDQKTVYIKA